MNTTEHYTAEQFNSLLDGRIAGDDRRRMQDHMSLCEECRSSFDSLARIDTALRRLPVLTVEPDFTRSVMDRILAPESSSLAFRLLEKLSYVFGLLIVLGVMVGSFVVTGVFDSTQLDQTRGAATGLASKAGEMFATSIGTFTTWLVQYLPFAFGKGSMGVAFFAVAVVAMIAAIDRLVARKVLQKRRAA